MASIALPQPLSLMTFLERSFEYLLRAWYERLTSSSMSSFLGKSQLVTPSHELGISHILGQDHGKSKDSRFCFNVRGAISVLWLYIIPWRSWWHIIISKMRRIFKQSWIMCPINIVFIKVGFWRRRPSERIESKVWISTLEGLLTEAMMSANRRRNGGPPTNASFFTRAASSSSILETGAEPEAVHHQ